MIDSLKRRHFIISSILLISVFLLIALLFKGLDLDPNKVPSPLVGKPAHPFRAAWIQGKEFVPSASSGSFKLDDLKGKNVVLNFWASWCYSCREEAHDFERFWQQQKGSDILVVGIAIQDTHEAAAEFAKYYGKSYILGLDDDGKIAIDYGVTGVPETFFIDTNGIVVHKEVGPVTSAKLAEIATKYF